jgi:hypothetical protein
MKLFRTLAGLCVFALAAVPAVAQRGGGASHGGGGGGHFSGGGGSHTSSGGESRSYGGGSSSVHVSGGSSYSGGRVVAYSGARGSSESYTYPGTGMHVLGAGGGSAAVFTNHGGIRFSDFGFEESPRFTASMVASRPATTTARDSFQIGATSTRSGREGSEWIRHSSFDHGGRDFFRFRHSGYIFFGAFVTPFCDPFGWAAYDQSFLYNNLDNGALGCFGQEGYAGLAYGPDYDDESAEPDYPSDDEVVAASPDDQAAPDSAANADATPQITLLQLKDGSMYGLTAYWVEGGELHYVTNYGGANAIPLDRIDLAKTVALNAAHGQAFVLRENSLRPEPGAQTH